MKILISGPFEPKQIFCEELGVDFPSGFGGVPVNLLVSELSKMGHEVIVVGTSSHINETWTHSKDNICAILVPARKRARYLALTHFNREIKSMVGEMEKLEFDVLHAHWTYEFAIAALKVDRNAVITAHDAPVTIFKWFKDPYRFLRLLMAARVRFFARNLTCVSPYLSEKWKSEMFWKKEISVIPNICPFIPINYDHNFPHTGRVITIGDSSKRKNIKNLILAMYEIRKTIPFATLEIFGHGLDLNSELALWAKKRSLDLGLKWNGFASRSDIREALDKSDLMIHPSYEEAQPMVPLEAMSRGLPIIGGFGAGGVPWTIEGVGVLANVRNPKDIAKQAVEILNNPKLSQIMSVNGIESVHRKYGPRVVAELYLEVYARVARH